MIKNFPFFSNLEDDSHCLQSCFKMILKNYYPEKDFTFGQLDKMTDKSEGKWAWPPAGLMELKKMGFEVKYFAKKIVDVFVENPEEHIKQIFLDHSDFIISQSDIPKEVEHFKEISSEGLYSTEKITIGDLERCFDEGYMVVVLINVATAKGIEGFNLHYVLMTGHDDKNIYVHNPGLPPVKNMKIDRDLFEKAWKYPRDECETFIVKK